MQPPIQLRNSSNCAHGLKSLPFRRRDLLHRSLTRSFPPTSMKFVSGARGVCIQVELVTGGLSPVCASCFTTSRPPCATLLRDAAPSSVLGHHRRRRYLRPIWALTILYDAEGPGTFARAPQLWRRSTYHRNIILANFKFTAKPLFSCHVFDISFLELLSVSCLAASLYRDSHELIFDYRLGNYVIYEKMIWRKHNPFIQ